MSAGRQGRPRSTRGDRGDQLRLVVAALTSSRGVHGDRHQEIPSGPRGSPARRHRLPERAGQALLPRVLERVQGAARDASERRAPLELQQRLRRALRQAQRRAGWEREPGIEPGAAPRAERLSFRPAPGAHGRQGEIQEAPDRPEGVDHAPSMEGGAYGGLTGVVDVGL